MYDVTSISLFSSILSCNRNVFLYFHQRDKIMRELYPILRLMKVYLFVLHYSQCHKTKLLDIVSMYLDFKIPLYILHLSYLSALPCAPIVAFIFELWHESLNSNSFKKDK